MSKKIVRDRVSFSKNWTAVIAGSLMVATAQQSHAANENSFRAFRDQNPDFDRATLRQMFREQRGVERNQSVAIPTPVLNAPTNSLPSIDGGSRAVRQLERRLEHNGTRNQTFQALDGQLVRVNKGIDLDLTSTTRNITLGSNLFNNASEITIKVGGHDKTLSAGDQVSAAEYVAVKQLLAGGGQKVTLDGQGRATGGDVDLSVLTNGNDTMRASDLVVPVNVTAIGDFNRGSDFRLLGDLNNSGTVHALTSGAHKNSGGALRADDIINNSGALIRSDVSNLLVDASGNFVNAGAISANGNITLQAGGTLTNSGSVSASGNVGINANDVTNTGSITSTKGDVNFSGADTAALNINNAGGTVSAERGAINFRSETYAGAFNNNISGGDFLSKEFNTHAGLGTSYVDVNQLTGTVNQTGAAAHVQAATENLEIGTVCLTGDPTYRNTMGSINISGNIDVAEALTVIAEGNITVDNNVHLNAGSASTGYDITLIAGADITGVSGGANIPSIPPGITGSVTINGNASTTGGSVIFGSNTNINTRGTAPGSPADGGSVNIFAFEGATAGSGKVDLGQTIIRTGAQVSGNNGSVTIVAGASSGDAIKVGQIITDQSSFGSGGSINITVAQPISSGGSISWGPDGQRTSSAMLISGADPRNGNIVFTGGDVNALGEVIVQAGGNITLTNATLISGDLTYFGTLGSLTADAASQIGGQNLYLYANNNIGSSTESVQTQAVNLNVTSVNGSAYIHSELGGVNLTNGLQSVAGDFVLTSTGDITVSSNINATNVSLTAGNPLNGSIAFTSAGQINASGTVSLTAQNAITADPNATITGTELTLAFTANSNLNTNVDGLTVTSGNNLSIHNAKTLTIHDVTVANSFSADTTATGNIVVDGDISATTVALINNNGNITLDGDILNAATATLNTQGGAGAIEQISGVVSAGGLSILAGTGGIGNNGALKFASNTLNVNSGGNASLAYTGTLPTSFLGANNIFGNFSLEAKQASVVGFGAGSSLSATGSIFINAGNIDLADRSVSGNGGITFKGDTDLVVSAAASPGAGLSTAGGNSIEFIAGNGNLTTNGFLNFAGGDAKMTLQNNNGTNSYTNNGTLNGDTTNDLIITSQVYNANGTVQNFANTIIINGNTIANSNGDVVLPSNLIFNGQNLAIIASGNITGTLTEINLGSASTGGGNLTILAGVAFTPATVGQVQSAQPFTITTASSSGGRIDLGSTNIITSSTVGNGGNVVLAAFAGSDQSLSTISVGNIDTSAASGFTSGSIRILGSGAITTGSLNTGAPSKGGVINVQAARAGNTGNIVVTDGTVTGLDNLVAEAFAGGSITVGSLSGQTANLTSTTGNISVSGSGGAVTNLNVTTTSGNYTHNTGGANNTVSNAVFTSNSGNFTVSGQNYQNLTSNVATGSVSVTNNFLNILVQGATGTAQNLTLSTAGASKIDIQGAVNLGTGNFSATSGGSGADAIKVGAAITAKDISLTSTLTALNGGITLNESITGTGTIALTSAGTIEQLAGKVINGGNLVVSEVTSAVAGLNLAVASLKVDNATDFTFTQTGNLELRELVASSVTGTVNGGNVTTGANISVPTFDLTVNNGNATFSNNLTSTTKATIEAQNISTTGTAVITSPLLVLTSTTGNIGSNASLLKVDAAELDLNAGAAGGIFISNANATSSELIDPITTTGTVRYETVGNFDLARSISANNIVLSAGSYSVIGDLTATTLIDITQTAGNITRANFALLSTPSLRLTATAGSIGTSATPFAVAAATNTIFGSGTSVYITSANTAGVTLAGGLANGVAGSGDFEFRTTGPLTVSGNVESTNGAILLQNTAGLLQIGSGVTILGDTAINIRNTGSVDEVDLIAIGANATIKTDTTTKGNGAGQINITQGVLKEGKVRKNIKNVVQNLQDGGQITFGGSKASYIAQAPDNTFNAIGANIYFSTDQTKKDGGLTFGGGVTITADPPVPAGSATITYGVRNAAPTTLELNATQPVNADTANIANVSLTPAVNATALTLNQGANNVANSLLNLATNDARMPGLVSDSSDNSYIVSYEPASLEVDAPVCTDLDIAITGGAVGTAGANGIATMPHSETITMNNGNALFVPSKDTTVVTPNGTVKIAANSVAMVMVNENHLSVYDVNDHHKRSVTVEAAGRSIALSPGRHVSIANIRTGQFADVNPMEAMMHRSVSSQELGDKVAFTSEFSLPAAVQVMKPLKAIFASDNDNAKKVAQRVLKTSAVIMQVSGNSAKFEHHVRPRRVAFNQQ